LSDAATTHLRAGKLTCAGDPGLKRHRGV
jgi:hypothetical protein